MSAAEIAFACLLCFVAGAASGAIALFWYAAECELRRQSRESKGHDTLTRKQ